MIDFSAIEEELVTRIGTGFGFISQETGRIRELVPITRMPSLDVSAQGHETKEDASRTYRVPVIAVIRRKGVDRTDNADAFKVLVEQVCDRLEGYKGASFDVIRELASQLFEEVGGDGAMVRSVVIRFVVLAH